MIMAARLNERQDAYQRLERVEEAKEVRALHPPLIKSKLKIMA